MRAHSTNVVTSKKYSQWWNRFGDTPRHTPSFEPVKYSAPTQVYLRWRPLIEEEVQQGQEEMIHGAVVENKFGVSIEPRTTEADCKQADTGPLTPRTKKRRRLEARMAKRSKNATGKPTSRFRSNLCFDGVVTSTENNEQTYTKTCGTLLDTIKQGGKAAIFCYGHTGSGKTHTIFGYGEEQGVYAHGIKELAEMFASLDVQDEGDRPIFAVRFCEVYNQGLYDLLDGRRECIVREGLGGEVQFRKRKDVALGCGGGVVQVVCKSTEEIEQVFEKALDYRQSGSSTVHDQSSRSHAFLEFEITTANLHNIQKEFEEQKRQAYLRFLYETDLTWLRKYPDLEIPKTKFRKFMKIVEGLEKSIEEYKERARSTLCPAVGADFILVDLAGNEHGSDMGKVSQSKQEEREGIEINKSLWNLNNVLRCRQAGKLINWRSSYLTRCLRKYLQDPARRCVMVTNLSPSEHRRKATIRSIQFAQTVATNSKK